MFAGTANGHGTRRCAPRRSPQQKGETLTLCDALSTVPPGPDATTVTFTIVGNPGAMTAIAAFLHNGRDGHRLDDRLHREGDEAAVDHASLKVPLTGMAKEPPLLLNSTLPPHELPGAPGACRAPGSATSTSIAMALRAGRYVAPLGPFGTGGTVAWWVRAVDSPGNVTTTPLCSTPVGATCIR